MVTTWTDLLGATIQPPLLGKEHTAGVWSAALGLAVPLALCCAQPVPLLGTALGLPCEVIPACTAEQLSTWVTSTRRWVLLALRRPLPPTLGFEQSPVNSMKCSKGF